MSDKEAIEKAVKCFTDATKEKDQIVKEAAEKIETVRQVQTESPNR